MSWPKGFYVPADVGGRSIELPAQTVVQSQVRLDLPTVLDKRIERSGANVLALGRALHIGIREPQQVFGIVVAIIRHNGVRTGVVECVLTVHVEVVGLVKARPTHVDSEFERVIAFNPGKAVRPLKAIAHLGQNAFPVIAQAGPT